jgi:diguanylate cyclase (GGDEF)-like protein
MELKLQRHVLILLSYFSFVFVLLFLTHGFSDNPSYSDIIISFLIMACIQVIVFRTLEVKPLNDFMNAIRRAINGDYKARFVCHNKSSLIHVSLIYNQLMSCVENQMDELSENRILQNQLYENEKIYRSALEITCERIFEADLTHNRLLYGFDKYSAAFPYLKTKIYDEMISSIAKNSVYPKDAKKFEETLSRNGLLKAFHSDHSPEVSVEYRIVSPNGRLIWYSASVIFLYSSSQTGLKIIGYVKNIDERKKQEIKIFNESQKDSLTGLFNRKVTETLIDQYLCESGKDAQHAVIMLDVDDFKSINDTYGHSQGDAALISVSKQLQRLFRSSDIVGRMGGDEFLILMKNISDENILFDKLRSIKSSFQEIRLGNASCRVHSSIGVSLYPRDGTSFAELFKKADMALYHSKANGKNQFCQYSDQFESDAAAKTDVTEVST